MAEGMSAPGAERFPGGGEAMAGDRPAEFFGCASELLRRGMATEAVPFGPENIYELAGGFPDDIPFYRELARGCGGPVLELGCGAGRVLLPLLNDGLHAAGLDLSPAMLALAREKLRAAGREAPLYEGDMRDFDLRESFSLVIIPYCTVAYLSVEDDLRRTFRAVRRHLRRGGFLAFDFETGVCRPGVIRSWLSAQTFDPRTGGLVLCTAQSKGLDRHRRFVNHIVYRWNQGQPPRITVEAVCEATVPAGRMRAILEEEGFTVKGLFRDYRFNPYRGGDLCVAVAERRD